MRQTDALLMRGQATRPNSTPYRCAAAPYRLIAYLAAMPPLLIVFSVAKLGSKAQQWKSHF